MDTHIMSTPDLDGIGAPLGSPIRLPGERGTLPHLEPHDGTLPPTLEHQDDGSINQPPADDAQAAAATAKAWPSRRRWLLGTVAAVVLLAGTGGVLWLQRHGMVNLPLPASLASTISATRGMPTGAAAMPTTIAEVGGPAVPAVKQTAAPARASAPVPALPSISPDMTDFAAFKNANGPSEVGARPTARPTSKPADASSSSSAPGEAGIAVTPPATPSPVAVASLSAPAIPAGAATPVPAPVAPPKPRDPIQTAIDLRADPMSPKQQVDAVGLVRELGAQLKDTRLTVAQLSETVADLKQQLEARTTEFDSRLTLSEADRPGRVRQGWRRNASAQHHSTRCPIPRCACHPAGCGSCALPGSDPGARLQHAHGQGLPHPGRIAWPRRPERSRAGGRRSSRALSEPGRPGAWPRPH